MTSLLTYILITVLGPLGLFVLPSGSPGVSRTLDTAQQNVNLALQKLPLSAEFLAYPARNIPDTRISSDSLPYRKWEVSPPDMNAKSAVVVGAKSGKIFYERNMRLRLPIASLTKLATALSVIEELSLNEEVTVSRHAVNTGGDFGNLVVGETLTAHDVLRAMLIASSNDAAVAFAEHVLRTRGKALTELMNAKTHALGLLQTRFSSVSGLEDRNNYSTAEDLSKLLGTVMHQSALADILKTDAADIHSTDGRFTHRLITSNKLLGRFDGVVAGKTGYTEGAGGSLAIFAKNEKSDDDFLVIVLGSANEETRFEDAKTLITWVNEAYQW
ncbi:MAG: serine hydrolase [bacterium]|nr:serine hydrolase [bacterium]